MASRRMKLTPFARFFIFLLFAAPLAYLGASYYNGEDGIAKIKSLLGQATDHRTDSSEGEVADMPETVPSNHVGTISRLQDDLKEKTARLERLYTENAQLKKDLEACQARLTE